MSTPDENQGSRKATQAAALQALADDGQAMGDWSTEHYKPAPVPESQSAPK